MAQRPALLLVDPGPARKRWLLERFLLQPVDLFAIVDCDDRWVEEMLPPERIVRAPLGQAPSAAHVDALLGGIGWRIDGVGTCYERSVTLAADLAARRGLPGPSPEAARRSSSSKIAMRQELAAAGVPNPCFAAADNPDGLASAAAAVGFPCVIKPASGADSAGVRKLSGPADLPGALRSAAALDTARRTAGIAMPDPRWLAEAYLAGPLVSVDGIVREREPTIFGLTETELGPEPWFNIEANWMPPRLDGGVAAALRRAALDAVRALGFVTCGFHAELRLTAAGPRVIEVAARVAGGAMPIGYLHSAGIDLAAIMTTLWLGGAPDLTPTRHRFVLQEGVFPRADGTLLSLDGLESARAVPGLFEFAEVIQPGERVTAGSAARPIYYYAVEAPDRPTLERRRADMRAAVHWTVG